MLKHFVFHFPGWDERVTVSIFLPPGNSFAAAGEVFMGALINSDSVGTGLAGHTPLLPGSRSDLKSGLNLSSVYPAEQEMDGWLEAFLDCTAAVHQRELESNALICILSKLQHHTGKAGLFFRLLLPAGLLS